MTHGSFGEVECEIKKWSSEEESDKLKGGTHTEASLQKLGWTEHLGETHRSQSHEHHAVGKVKS
jgi:hypothetical protein